MTTVNCLFVEYRAHDLTPAISKLHFIFFQHVKAAHINHESPLMTKAIFDTDTPCEMKPSFVCEENDMKDIFKFSFNKNYSQSHNIFV